MKEALGETTNQYTKLANLWMARQTNQMGYDNLALDNLVDPWDYCRKAEELFTLYKRCATRKQEEGLEDFIEALDLFGCNTQGQRVNYQN